MAPRDPTLASYRRNAADFAAKFEARPGREDDVARVLRLAGVPNPRVLEVGFGSGREAGLFLEAGAQYHGVDYAPEFVAMARGRFPGARFEAGDVRACPLPSGMDAVCAIASLVHLGRRDLAAVLARLGATLRPGGVLAGDLRAADRYRRDVRAEGDGSERAFYFFSEAGFRAVAAVAGLTVEALEKREYGGSPWWWFVLRR